VNECFYKGSAKHVASEQSELLYPKT